MGLGHWSMRALWLLALHVLFVGSPSSAQTGLEPQTFSEFVDAKERISGENPVGFVTLDGGDKVTPQQLFVYVPRPSKFEVFINSVDGRYAYEAVYSIEADKEKSFDWIQVELKTQHDEFIREYDLDQLAVLVRPEKAKQIFPARWGTPELGGVLMLYVNTERAKAYFGRQLCSPPSKHFGFKFNYVCSIPVGSIAEGGAISIRRKHGVRRLDPIDIRVSLPNG